MDGAADPRSPEGPSGSAAPRLPLSEPGPVVPPFDAARGRGRSFAGEPPSSGSPGPGPRTRYLGTPGADRPGDGLLAALAPEPETHQPRWLPLASPGWSTRQSNVMTRACERCGSLRRERRHRCDRCGRLCCWACSLAPGRARKRTGVDPMVDLPRLGRGMGPGVRVRRGCAMRQINDDYSTECDCCDTCTQECADAI